MSSSSYEDVVDILEHENPGAPNLRIADELCRAGKYARELCCITTRELDRLQRVVGHWWPALDVQIVIDELDPTEAAGDSQSTLFLALGMRGIPLDTPQSGVLLY